MFVKRSPRGRRSPTAPRNNENGGMGILQRVLNTSRSREEPEGECQGTKYNNKAGGITQNVLHPEIVELIMKEGSDGRNHVRVAIPKVGNETRDPSPESRLFEKRAKDDTKPHQRKTKDKSRRRFRPSRKSEKASSDKNGIAEKPLAVGRPSPYPIICQDDQKPLVDVTPIELMEGKLDVRVEDEGGSMIGSMILPKRKPKLALTNRREIKASQYAKSKKSEICELLQASSLEEETTM